MSIAQITPAMARRIEIWPVERLMPCAKNARTHSVEQVPQIAASIALGVPEPSPATLAAVKEADFRAALAEGVLGCTGRGYEHTRRDSGTIGRQRTRSMSTS
jgi:hypothetical protein